MRCLLLSALMLFGLAFAAAPVAAQKKSLDKKAPDAKAPEKKTPTAKVVLQGQTYEVLRNSDDGAGVAYRGNVRTQKWIEADSGGFWTVSNFTWTVSVPQETPWVRVLVPFMADSRITVAVDDLEAWKLDRAGLIAKGSVSPVLATPGANGMPSRIVVQVTGGVSNVILLVSAKDAPATKADGKDDGSAAKATDLLAKAKEALESKNVSLAKIRLKLIIAEYSRTPAAEEARLLLKSLDK